MCAFELNTQQLDKLLKASAIYQLPDLSAVGEAGVVKLVVRDKRMIHQTIFPSWLVKPIVSLRLTLKWRISRFFLVPIKSSSHKNFCHDLRAPTEI